MLRVGSVSLASLGRLQSQVSMTVTSRALHMSRAVAAIQIKMPSLVSHHGGGYHSLMDEGVKTQ